MFRRQQSHAQEKPTKPESPGVLDILDDCARGFTFPMLDNGYVYLAATRMALYRSTTDWALVIEVFGYSPRAGIPDLHIHTFASQLRDRDRESKHVTKAAYDNYLTQHPHDEHRFIYPLDEDGWIDGEDVAADTSRVVVRGEPVPLPPAGVYAEHGIELQAPPMIGVFELCRYLADIRRDLVLATRDERRASVLTDLDELMVLDEWNHPDLVVGELPSESQTFRQLAQVLETGDIHRYQLTDEPNTHWRNWPDGGLL